MPSARRFPVVVTSLNPAIDAEWRVSRVVWEEKNVLEGEHRWPGGKGINVARWLRQLGVPVRLLLPLGGAPGRELAAGLRQERLVARVLRLRQPTRVNVVVTTRRQGQMRFNPPGPELDPGEWQRFQTEARRLCASASALVLSGSLPRGVPADAYVQLIRTARLAGIPALLDCEGEALRHAAPAGPWLVKPNAHELRAWRPAAWRGSNPARNAALALSRATGGWVLVSRGAEAALLVHAGDAVCYTARPPRVRVLNTVGAGDALLAAATVQMLRGASPGEWLRHGLAAGTAAASTPAGELPPLKQVASLAAAIRVRAE